MDEITIEDLKWWWWYGSLSLNQLKWKKKLDTIEMNAPDEMQNFRCDQNDYCKYKNTILNTTFTQSFFTISSCRN